MFGPRQPLTDRPMYRPLVTGPSWAIIVLLLVGVLLISAVAASYLRYQSLVSSVDLSSITKLRYASGVYDAQGERLGAFAEESRFFVALEQIPQHLIDAVVATEDQHFFEHQGYSLLGLMRAVWVNARQGKFAQGASTITQQTVRMRFLSQKKSLLRKWDEILLAIAIEKQLSKKQILEAYLNGIYFGHAAYGVEAAAQNYFRKHVWQLDTLEAASLAGVIQAPSRFGLQKSSPAVWKRKNKVLERMRRAGKLSGDIFEDLLTKRPRVFAAPRYKTNDAPFALALARRELERRLGTIDSAGYRIETTLNRSLQELLSEQLSRLPFSGTRRESIEVSAIVIGIQKRTIEAWTGSRHFSHSQFDRVFAGREMGGLIAPIIAGLALDRGLHLPSSIFRENKWDTGKGDDLSLLDALRTGRHEDLARVYAWIGGGTLQSALASTGAQVTTSDFDLALGKESMSLYQLAMIFAALASDGQVSELSFLRNVTDDRGTLIYSSPESAAGSPVFSAEAAYLVRFAYTKFNKHAIVSVDRQRHHAHAVVIDGDRLLLTWLGYDRGTDKLGSDADEVSRRVEAWAIQLVDRLGGSSTRDHLDPEGIGYKSVMIGSRQSLLPFKIVAGSLDSSTAW